MSQNESYHVNESLRNDLRLRKILDELPEFTSRYFYANEFSLSARTRVAYAYDLRTFFRYIIKKSIATVHAGTRYCYCAFRAAFGT